MTLETPLICGAIYVVQSLISGTERTRGIESNEIVQCKLGETCALNEDKRNQRRLKERLYMEGGEWRS